MADHKLKFSLPIIIPKGCLRLQYWYEMRPSLLKDEKTAMKRFFPQFKLEKLDDGRLYWQGKIDPKIKKNASWYLQAIYDNNHPHNNTFGGSIKVYSIDPDLDSFQKKLGEAIPHTLRDANDNIYICTSRKEDFIANNRLTMSASSCIAWAIKWIAAFELWALGELSTKDFWDHKI